MGSTECQCLRTVTLYSISIKKHLEIFLETRPTRVFLMSSGMITFETFSRIYIGAEVVCCYEAYLEMIHSMCGYCLFLNLGMNQGCCHTVISTTEDVPHVPWLHGCFFTKNNSCLEHGGGLQLVSPQLLLQLHLHAWITGLCFQLGEGWYASL